MRRNALPSACGMSPLRNSSNLSSSFACRASQLLTKYGVHKDSGALHTLSNAWYFKHGSSSTRCNSLLILPIGRKRVTALLIKAACQTLTALVAAV